MKPVFKKLASILTAVLFLAGQANAEPSTPNPCAGANALLNLIDRPNNADSACPVPLKQIIIESGYQNQRLTNSNATLQTYSNSEIRFGLPANNELFVLLPTYNHQSFSPHFGNTETIAGLKHLVDYNQKWMFTVEAAFVFPDGSTAYGSKESGGTTNAIINYSVNSQFALSLMVGASSITQSRYNGGERFNSFNPDLVLSYNLSEKINVFGEVYGQTKTAPNEHQGFNADVGLLYMPIPSIVFDINAGQRLNGYPNAFENYFGAGVSFLIK